MKKLDTKRKVLKEENDFGLNFPPYQLLYDSPKSMRTAFTLFEFYKGSLRICINENIYRDVSMMYLDLMRDGFVESYWTFPFNNSGYNQLKKKANEIYETMLKQINKLPNWNRTR